MVAEQDLLREGITRSQASFRQHRRPGLVFYFSAVLVEAALTLRASFCSASHNSRSLDLLPEQSLLSVVVMLFMIDCLISAMINPIYILISWAIAVRPLPSVGIPFTGGKDTFAAQAAPHMASASSRI